MGISALLFVAIVGFVVGCLIGGSIVGHFVISANDRVKEDLYRTREWLTESNDELQRIAAEFPEALL